MDFVKLFASVGLDHATAHIFLLLVSSANEKCWLWTARGVSRAWNQAVASHALVSKVGKICLEQRRIKQMR